MGRWIRFLIAIGVGFVIGLYYAWNISPVEYVNTTPDSLHVDFKTDYVLMVAEAYSMEVDLHTAVRRLALLGDDPPYEIVAQALRHAVERGYSTPDLMLIQALSNAMQVEVPQTPVQEVPTP